MLCISSLWSTILSFDLLSCLFYIRWWVTDIFSSYCKRDSSLHNRKLVWSKCAQYRLLICLARNTRFRRASSFILILFKQCKTLLNFILYVFKCLVLNRWTFWKTCFSTFSWNFLLLNCLVISEKLFKKSFVQPTDLCEYLVLIISLYSIFDILDDVWVCFNLLLSMNAKEFKFLQLLKAFLNSTIVNINKFSQMTLAHAIL